MSDNERWELRPCKDCGHVRRVRVRDRREFVPDGTTVIERGGVLGPQASMARQGGEFKVTGETFNETCRACDLEKQLRVYERAINRLARQIAEERQRQRRADERRREKEGK